MSLTADDHSARRTERPRRRIEQLRAIERTASGSESIAATGHQHASIAQGRGGVSVARLGHDAGGPAEGVRARVEQLGGSDFRVLRPADEQHTPVQEHRRWGAVMIMQVLHRARRDPSARQRRRSIEQQPGRDDAACQETQCQNRQERPSQRLSIRQSQARSGPPATTGDGGLMGDGDGVERPRGDGGPSAEALFETRLEVEPVSHHGAPFGGGREGARAGRGSPMASARSRGPARSSRTPRRSAGPAAPGRRDRGEPAHW